MFSGLAFMLLVAPRYVPYMILPALFFTIPPILIVVRDLRERHRG